MSEGFDGASGAATRDARVGESIYRAFFKDDSHGVLLATAESEILDANERACRLLGRTRKELLTRGGGAIFDSSDRRLGAARREQGFTGNFRGKLRLLRRAGGVEEPFTAAVTVVGYRDREAGEERLVIVIRDVAGRREAPDPIRGTEEWFFSLVRYASDVVVVFDAAGGLRYASPSVERVLGYTPEELAGTVTIDTVHPDDFERVMGAFAEVWDSPGINAPVEHRVRHKDGRWLHMEMAANNLLDDPQVRGVVMIARDVTERVRAEAEIRRLNEALERRVAERAAEIEENERALRESEQRFRTTFEQAATGIAHVAPDGRWLRVNRKLCRIVGYDCEELQERTLQAVTHPDDLEGDLEQIERLLSGEIESYSTDKRCIRKDGSYGWMELGVSLVRKPSGEPDYFIVVVEDADERKKAELILNSLTPREKEVLSLIVQGRSNPEIAQRLFITERTAKFHVKKVVEKLEATDRLGAALRAVELGLVPGPAKKGER